MDWLEEAQQRWGGGLKAGGRVALETLAARLGALPAAEGAAVAKAFLASGRDARSGLGFKPGKNGRLAEAPILRVFLMDFLRDADPAAAAALAREILREDRSPDEWAMALRNLAQVDQSAEAKTFLETKMTELLRKEVWHKDPSEGYLEAFDVAVHLGGTHLVSPLAELLRKQDNKPLSYAAFLALDRLVLKDTPEVLGVLLAELNLMEGRELTRANYFARATVSDPRQREVIERYLLDARLSPAELDRFAGLFPNASYLLSQNLITRTEVPDEATLATRDRAALSVVEGWLKEARFAGRRPQLQAMRARLAEFVGGADHRR